MLRNDVSAITFYDEDRLIITAEARFCLNLDESAVVYDGPIAEGLDVLEAIVSNLVDRINTTRATARPLTERGDIG